MRNSLLDSLGKANDVQDKYSRQLMLGCLSRLIWTYLFRCTESTSITFKKLDTIVKSIFPPYRRSVYLAETPLDHFILITYFALMRDVDSAMQNIVFFLLNAEAGTTMQWENINPERMIIALRAFRLMLHDLERGITRPPFPADPDMLGTGISMQCSANIFSGPIRALKPDITERVEEIIDKSLIMLDQVFGKLLVLDEKNILQKPPSTVTTTTGSSGNYSVPIFANTVGISGTSEGGPQVQHQYSTFSVSYSKDKQIYFDLLKTIFDSMPRLMPAGISLPKLVEILSPYTVHVDPELIESSSRALVRIAEQIDSQTVVTGYARFVYRIEDKYCDVLTSLASGYINSHDQNGSGGVLKLYVDLLTIWVNRIDLAPLKEVIKDKTNIDEAHRKSKTPSKSKSDPQAEASSDVNANVARLFNTVAETEANGLLFLCNQSSAVRQTAIRIIKLAALLEERLRTLVRNESDPALTSMLNKYLEEHFARDREYERLYHFLESAGQEFVQYDKDTETLFGCKISTELQNRLQQLQRKGAKHALIQIAESLSPIDAHLWNIWYPEVFKRCHAYFQGTVTLCRQNICTRLLQIQPYILASLETAKAGTTGTLSMGKNSAQQKVASTELIEQWKIYLIFACATVTPSENRAPSTSWTSTGRKGSAVVQKIATPQDLFRMMMQFLTSEHRQIREAAIQGLGNVNQSAYKLLVSELQSHVRIILDEGKQRSNQKPYQNKRSKKNDRLRISLMHVFELTADCLQEKSYLEDKELMQVILSYIKETKSFLADNEVQLEWEYHKLRVYLCKCVEKLYENIMRLDDPSTIISFETRLSLYKMFEEWCGYGVFAETTRTREAAMMRDVLEQCKDPNERASITQLMEEERSALEVAALSAMAMLCVSGSLFYAVYILQQLLTSELARSPVCFSGAKKGTASSCSV